MDEVHVELEGNLLLRSFTERSLDMQCTGFLPHADTALMSGGDDQVQVFAVLVAYPFRFILTKSHSEMRVVNPLLIQFIISYKGVNRLPTVR